MNRNQFVSQVLLLICLLSTSALFAQSGDFRVLSHSPKGETQGRAQIKIDFSAPLIGLTTLSEGERAAVLSNFKIQPEVAGKFRLQGTSSVVFEPTHSLPMASNYTVTVLSGLKNIHGNKLGTTFQWQFQTPRPQINIRPNGTQRPIRLDRQIEIHSNVALDETSLREKTSFYETHSSQPVSFTLTAFSRNPKPNEDIGRHRLTYRYFLKAAELLQKATQYSIIIESGVLPRFGNRSTNRRTVANVVTFSAFRFEGVGQNDHCGNKLFRVPRFNLSNRVNTQTWQENITFDPPFKQWPLWQDWDGLPFNDYYLEANSTYRVTLGAGLEDEYGQKLENPQTIIINTGKLQQKIWGPRGYQVITTHLPPQLAVKTVELDNVSFKLQKLRPSDILVRERLDHYYQISNLFKFLQTPSSRREIELNDARVGKSIFDLKPYFSGGRYGAVAYSFENRVDCYERPIVYNGLILRTDIGIYSQFYPGGGIIKLNKLTNGEFIPNAKIKIYREEDLPRLNKIWDLITDTQITPITPCTEGVTDASGMWMLSASDLIACTKRRITNKVLNEMNPPEADPDEILYNREKYGFVRPPRLLIVVESGDDWTFLQTDDYGNPSAWQFGVTADWEAERPIGRGTIFSDHFIYRPGDTVKMKGLSRYLQYGELKSDIGAEYELKLRGPQGVEKEIGKVKVSGFGTFHFEIPTREDQMLGYYTVSARTPQNGLVFYGTFRLAEFRVPEFKVVLDVDLKYALPDSQFNVSWEGKYYFGAAMQNAKANLNITRRRTYFTPKNWEAYQFGIPQHLDKKVSLSGTYHREEFSLNTEGKGGHPVTLSTADVPFPMTYMCDLEITDVSNQTIAAKKSFTALPDNRLVGIQLSNWIISAKNPIDVEVIVTSPEGEPLPGIAVNLTLVKREHHSVRTKTPDGRYESQFSVVDLDEGKQTVTSGNKPVTATFTPQKAGSYIVRADFVESPPNGSGSATSLWVSGRDYVPWADNGEDKLEIILDKYKYEIGETATAFIKSPFPEAELFLTISRDRILRQETKRVQGSAITYTFTVTEDMLPNAFLGAALFRIGDAIVPIVEEKGKHMERIGIAPFGVSLDTKRLDVSVSANKKSYRPSEEVALDLHIGLLPIGHRSELTVMVVDEAVLSLTGYKPPDLVNIVYAERGLSARLNDNRPFVITEAELLQKGVGYGGGLLGGFGDPKVRKEFVKLAYYDPDLVTNSRGHANIKFKLPDNLTTWRIMIIAVGENDLFGYGDQQIIVKQPFITRAVFPRFARQGDQFDAGVAVTNLTESAGEVSVQATFSGNSVALDSHSGEISGVYLKPGESKTVLFPMQATGVGACDIKLVSRFNGMFAGNSVTEADALQTMLNVEKLVATETVVAVGETREQALQKIKIDDSVRKDVGGLGLVLSSTALTNIGEGARYLVEYPYGCLEQTTSRLLTLMQLQELSTKYGFELTSVKSYDKVIEANLRKVMLMRNSDGGFKFWPSSSNSACYITPYVAYLFNQANTLGYEIPEDVITGLADYLDKTLRNPCFKFFSWRGEAEYRINHLIGLHHLGRKDETYFDEYFTRRNALSFGAKIQLAYLLGNDSKWRQEALTVFEEIKNGMFVTALTAYIESPRELPGSWRFLDSAVITTASALKLFLLLEPESPYIAKMTRYLLNARKNGRWRYTYENARAIDGLMQVSTQKEATPPDFIADVFVSAKNLVSEKFSGYQYKPRESFTDMLNLPEGEHDIRIGKKGAGTLYYTLSYSYRMNGPQSARDQGLTIQRTVRNSETGVEIASYKEQPSAPVTIAAGDVLEVELEYNVRQTSYHVVIDDPLPPGLEAIDTSLKTTSARHRRSRQSKVTRGGYRSNPVNHTEMRDDRVVLVADQVEPGIYRYKYMARATTSGQFLWPAARIELMYEPEQFGSNAEGYITIAAPEGVVTTGR